VVNANVGTDFAWVDDYQEETHDMSQIASAPKLSITLTKHTGMLIFFRRQRVTFTGTFEQCEAAYKKVQTYNLIFGWWGVLSLLIINPLVIFGNMSAMGELRRIAGGVRPALT
jgi:hypothetical protein